MHAGWSRPSPTGESKIKNIPSLFDFTTLRLFSYETTTNYQYFNGNIF